MTTRSKTGSSRNARAHAVQAIALWLALGAATGPSVTCLPREAAAPAATRALPLSTPALVYEKVVDGNQDLYLLREDGSEFRLTDDPAQDGLPRWTPDGQAVVFSSNRGGQWQLWKLPIEGGEATRLRTNSNREWQADVSDDATTLAFLSNAGGSESLWLMDLRSRVSRLLVRHGRNSVLGNPDWSPDGRRIVFSSNWKIGHHIYVVDATSGETERLSGVFSGGCEPRMSPDGRKVVFVSRGHHRPRSWLVEHDLESGQQRVLVDWNALNYDPAYSPDGSEIAFASNLSGEYAVYRYRLADRSTERVTAGPHAARYPDYRPLRSR